MTDFPAQGTTYLGPITDTRRWQNFEHRSDDIFVCTPPKCGTTWTQAICAMLVFGTADHGQQPGMVSPWIDAAFEPIDVYLKKVQAQKHRRFLKTHTPLDGIPYHEACTYLAVFRNPLDVYFSGLNHRDNMTDQELAHAAFPSGPDPYNDWLQAVREPGGWDLNSLDSLCHFLKSYWNHRDLPNVHLHHYSDMTRDLPGAIADMAVATGVELSEDQLSSYTRAASFDHMKSNAEQFAPESGTGMWKAESNFFANGGSAQWQDRLSDEELAAFDARLVELLPDEKASWLVHGNGS